MPRARNRLVLHQAEIDSLATMSAMEEFLGQIVRVGRDAAAANSHEVTGELRDSWYGVVEDGVGYVGSDSDHAQHEEFGTIDTPAHPTLRPAIDDMRRAAERG